MLDGRYILTRIGCELAADPIGRQEPISLARKAFERAYPGIKPEFLLVSCHPAENDEEELARPRALQAFLDGDLAERIEKALRDGPLLAGEATPDGNDRLYRQAAETAAAALREGDR